MIEALWASLQHKRLDPDLELVPLHHRDPQHARREFSLLTSAPFSRILPQAQTLSIPPGIAGPRVRRETQSDSVFGRRFNHSFGSAAAAPRRGDVDRRETARRRPGGRVGPFPSTCGDSRIFTTDW